MLTFFKKNFDEIAILALFAKVKFEENPDLTADEENILSALIRSTNDLSDDATLDQVSEYLSSYTPESLHGIANNVKGILHEIEFVQLENSNGDNISASMFTDTNHEGYDIQFFDENNILFGEAQLKATDNVSYVREWMEKNDGDIIVTSEIAEKMGLPSSGISNEGLTVSTNDFIDKMVSGDFDSNLQQYFPYLSIISISIIIYELWGRYQKGNISYDKFKVLSMYATGYKASKIAALTILLSIPFVNIFVSIALIANLLSSFSGQVLDVKKRFIKQDPLSQLTVQG